MTSEEAYIPNAHPDDFIPGVDDIDHFDFDLKKIRNGGTKTSQDSDGGSHHIHLRRRKDEIPDEETLKQRKNVRKQQKVQNKEILVVMYLFLAIFISTIGYYIYFNVTEAKTVANSPYNTRASKLAESTVRGNITASDGEILAQTVIDESGNETRNYPYSNVFAHVIGTSEVNLSGLESSNNYDLLNSDNNPLSNAWREIQGQKKYGDTVVTTLDVDLQQAAYDALGDNDGVVIAIEPDTGRVLAMVSKPDYDPNTLADTYSDLSSDEGSKVLLNQATSGTFVPGSIFKTFTALEYIHEHPDDYEDYEYTCYGQIDLANDEAITCYNGTVHGTENINDSFAYSCNSSFGNIGLGLDIDSYTQLCEDLFFNKDLPTSIPHVQSQFTLSQYDNDWRIAATAIGQGDTVVTPLHMAMISASIANGGILMQPYLIDRVDSSKGATVKKIMPESYGSIMSTSDASMLGELMKGVADYGTATALLGNGYEVAGKTGTAEVEGSGDNSWFMGYAPADQPRIAICVLVENPEGSYSSALPIADEVFQNYINR